jgi:hypothetical protein
MSFSLITHSNLTGELILVPPSGGVIILQDRILSPISLPSILHPKIAAN